LIKNRKMNIIKTEGTPMLFLFEYGISVKKIHRKRRKEKCPEY